MSDDFSRILEYLKHLQVQRRLGLSSSELGEFSAEVFIAATEYTALREGAKRYDQMSRVRQMESYGVKLPSAAVEYPIEGWTDSEIHRHQKTERSLLHEHLNDGGARVVTMGREESGPRGR